MSSKELLKATLSFFKENKNQEVLGLLEPLIADGNEEYLIFCYAALASWNLRNIERAKELYRKATEIDKSQPTAWKGAFKIYESDIALADDFGLAVCDEIIAMKESDDKVAATTLLKQKMLFEMKMWIVLCKNIPTDEDLLFKIAMELVDLGSTCKERKLLKRAIQGISMESLKKERKLFLSYIDMNPEAVSEHFDYMLTDPLMKSSSFCQEKILLDVCTEYFRTGKVDQNWTHLSNEYKAIREIIESLADNDVTGALELADHVKFEEKKDFPGCLIHIPLLAEVEQWEKCLELVKLVSKQSTEKNLDGWRIRAIYEIDGLAGIQKAIAEPPLPQFWKEAVLVAHVRGTPMESLQSQFDEKTKTASKLFLHLLDESNESCVEELEKFPDLSWSDWLMIAEAKLNSKQDATAILVKTAKLNPRSSRVFYLLGKSLAVKNPTKAKALVERSVKIRPTSEEYVQLYDELLAKSGAKDEDRVQHLNRLETRFHGFDKPRWLFERLSTIYLNLNNLDRAIEELQQLVRMDNTTRAWSRLADAYKKRGNLRAAVSSYEHLSQLEGGRHYMLPMIQVLIQLREFAVALEKMAEYRELGVNGEQKVGNVGVAADALEANIHLSLLETTYLEERKVHLKKAIALLRSCVTEQTTISLVYKLAGDALLKVCEYAEKFWNFDLPAEWGITDRKTCANKACFFFAVVLELNKKSVLAWHDMAVAIVTASKVEKDVEMLKKAKACIKQGLKLTKVPSMLSSLWTVMAQVVRLLGQPVTHEHHCLIRAVTLNKTNDTAWLLIAIMYFIHGDKCASNTAFTSAVNFNTQNAAAWSGWSIHAHEHLQYNEARYMFKQSLTQQPSPTALIGYTIHLLFENSQKQDRFDSAKEVFNFDSILDLFERHNTNEQSIYYLGILCELFGYYEEAVSCFEKVKASGAELERVEWKAKLYDHTRQIRQQAHPANGGLRSLMTMSKEELRDELQRRIPNLYNPLFLTMSDGEQFAKFYERASKVLSVPLVVAALITFDYELTTMHIAALHDALPRHELIDVFPTAIGNDMDNGLRHLEQDGEEPFRYRNRVAKDLFDLLKTLREEYDANNPAVTPTSIEIESL